MLWPNGQFQNVVRMIATPERGKLSARLISSTMFSEFEGDWTVCLLVTLSCSHRLPYLLPPLSKMSANARDLHDDLLICVPQSLSHHMLPCQTRTHRQVPMLLSCNSSFSPRLSAAVATHCCR